MAAYPTRDEIVAAVAKAMYKGKILNNSHRGDVVEMMVLAALGSDWEFVGLGWNLWDLEKGAGEDRVRIQVKQTAAWQLWGKTKTQSLSLNWRDYPPEDFEQHNPGEPVEHKGWFCEVFVFGVHRESDKSKVDQVDPKQWEFLVIPTCDLKEGAKTMGLNVALTKWSLCRWHELPEAVDQALRRLRESRGSQTRTL